MGFRWIGLKPFAKPALLVIGLTGGALALRLLPFGDILKSHAHSHADARDIGLFVGLGALACAVGVPGAGTVEIPRRRPDARASPYGER